MAQRCENFTRHTCSARALPQISRDDFARFEVDTPQADVLHASGMSLKRTIIVRISVADAIAIRAKARRTNATISEVVREMIARECHAEDRKAA